ncbi:MAG: right-handed parallel beta-helix repeat-containing protein, partial [Planctomycetes bacterium]|nr:right-handed parallel beta-helix repeat-containing protein [Planctomycetota bacterium]
MRYVISGLIVAIAALVGTQLSGQYAFAPFTVNNLTTVAQDFPMSVGSVPAGTYTSFTVTADWSAGMGDPYSNEARLTLTDGAATTYYAEAAPTSGAQATVNPVTITWSGTLSGGYTGGGPLTLRARQTYDIGSFSVWSNVVLTINTTTPPYGPPTFTNPGLTGDYCAGIQINTSPAFNQTITESATDYNYHSGISATFAAGQSYTITLTNNALYDGGIAVWLDYNGDGDYADANELLGQTAILAASAIGTINFTVPPAITPQAGTRFRLIQVYNAVPADPVGSYAYGQCDEYDAVTTPPPAGPEINIQDPSSVSVASAGTYIHATPLVGGTTGPALTFTIQNFGTVALTINSALLTGTPAGCAPTIQTPPVSPVPPTTGSTPFIINVNPDPGFGAWSFQFTVDNDDVDEALYVVNVQGSRGMTGTYTVNSAGGADYMDVGDAFEALEDFGVVGAVTFEVTGTFTSNTNYELGRDDATVDLVEGVSASNTVTFRGMGASKPVISGSAALGPYAGLPFISTMIIMTPYVTLENLEVTGGFDAGIVVISHDTIHLITGVNILKCSVHGVTGGPGIFFVNGTGPLLATNCTVQNCLIYACVGSGTLNGFGDGALSFHNIGTGFTVDHNTILHNNGAAASGAVHLNTPYAVANSSAVSVFTNNIIVNSTNATPLILDGGSVAPTTDPLTCDYNYWYATNGATFHSAVGTYVDFLAWQTTGGKDTNGSSADPLLQNTGVGTEDLHLQPTSPAIDDADPLSSVAEDFEGDARPQGPAKDAGADEAIPSATAPLLEVSRLAPILRTNTDTVTGTTVGITGSISWDIDNTGTANLDVTAIAISNSTNVNAAITSGTVFTITPSGTTVALDIDIQPTATNWSFDVTITSNDPGGPFTFTVNGTAAPGNAPAEANPTTAPVSSFAGPTNGPLTQTVAPGATLADASIILTDAEN